MCSRIFIRYCIIIQLSFHCLFLTSLKHPVLQSQILHCSMSYFPSHLLVVWHWFGFFLYSTFYYFFSPVTFSRCVDKLGFTIDISGAQHTNWLNSSVCSWLIGIAWTKYICVSRILRLPNGRQATLILMFLSQFLNKRFGRHLL